MIDWNIQTRSHTCQVCHRHFADKEAFRTTLFEQRHGYERKDFCEDCWARHCAEAKEGSQSKALSQWQSVYVVPPASAPDPILKDTAESLLHKLIERNDASHAGARFILAVMLERKRQLKNKGHIMEGGVRVLIYEHPKTGDVLMIKDPGLKINQLEEVQRDVLNLLEHGLEPLPSEATATPAPEASPVAVPDATVEPSAEIQPVAQPKG